MIQVRMKNLNASVNCRQTKSKIKEMTAGFDMLITLHVNLSTGKQVKGNKQIRMHHS